jgi:hypothetical protein
VIDLMRSLALCAIVPLAVTVPVHPQNQPHAQGPAAPALAGVDDYPMDRAGIFIKGAEWKDVKNQAPFKTKAAHGIAASLSYGIVPAKVVAEYEGDHAPTQAENTQPILCICHMVGLPGEPVIVRLHPKKTSRELDGGKMIVYPVVGGSKMADANKTDLIPVDVSHPDPQVWIVRPQVALPAGEYALMLGTQNVSIFPFTVGP